MAEIGERRAWALQAAPAALAPGIQRRKSHVWIFLAILAALASANVALGANPLTVVLCLLSVLVGVYALARYGTMNIAAILVFLATFRYVGFPFVVKLVLGQPLDSNLRQPLDAFLVVLVGMAGYLVALAAADKIPVGRPILSPVLEGGRLGFLSVWAAVLGVAANVSVSLGGAGQGRAITVASFFLPLLNVALIAATGAALTRTHGRRAWDAWVISLVALTLGFAMVRNSRMAVMVTVLSFLVAVVAFRGRATARQALTLAAASLVIVAFLTPVMLSVRSGRDALSWYQRIGATISSGINWRSTESGYQAWRQGQLTSFGLLYFGASQNALERLSLVNHVDLLKSATDATGRVGLGDLAEAAPRVLPRFAYADKPLGYGHGYWLYRQLGISNSGPYASAPLVGTGYAALGWAGAFAYPLVFGFTILIMLKKVSGWDLHGNIWAVYFLVTLQNDFVEGSTDAVLTSIFRSIPQDLAVLAVLVVLSRLSSHSVRRRSVVAR